jgi:hypothetical protein
MESWLQRRLSRISLRELNFYTILFILFVTLIFSSLLIYDEYKDFLKTAQHTMMVGQTSVASNTLSFQDCNIWACDDRQK